MSVDQRAGNRAGQGAFPQVRLALLGSEGALHTLAPQREEIVDSD